MLGERTLEHDRSGPDDGSLPTLTAVLVAPADALDDLLRVRRAEVAHLRLRLRALEGRSLEPAPPTSPTQEAPAARALLVASLERHAERRRLELAEALDVARVEAAAVISRAHGEVNSLVAAAHSDVVGALLAGTRAPATAPTLRLVDDAAEDATDEEPTAAVAPVPSGAETTDGQVEDLVRRLAAALPPVEVAPVHSLPAADGEHTSRWSLRSFLYLDVLLPLIAIVIVIVVLLAWAG